MRIIGLTGKKRHGKDSCCGFVRELVAPLPVVRFSFADALKRECADLLDITVEDIEADKERFRLLLQWWGTNWRRHQDPDYWVNQLRQKLTVAKATQKGHVAVVTDCRFPNEADMLRSLGGIIVRVIRDQALNLPYDPHESETAMDGYHCDQVIVAADLEMLKTETRRMLETADCLSGGTH